MSTYFKYAGKDYATLAEADAASTEMKDNLENKPTKWCMVVAVSGDADTGWTVSGTRLTDQEILNLSGDGLYNYNAHHTGENFIGITAAEVLQHVTEDRAEYVRRTGPNQIQEMKEIYVNGLAIQTFVGEPVAPTVEDMSGYPLP